MNKYHLFDLLKWSKTFYSYIDLHITAMKSCVNFPFQKEVDVTPPHTSCRLASPPKRPLPASPTSCRKPSPAPASKRATSIQIHTATMAPNTRDMRRTDLSKPLLSLDLTLVNIAPRWKMGRRGVLGIAQLNRS